jgi:hypothetical protein
MGEYEDTACLRDYLAWPDRFSGLHIVEGHCRASDEVTRASAMQIGIQDGGFTER